ncbi:rhomboid family intramembrane serine protease [Nocardiopsis sp. HNM0947]|uniref:Rhomboid family intramembrane serine protease n=1 Tax=Nocardiopsis coralli TaxID=2772213 RepID=A0ABR9PD79_9ACTN|nr:rhomboid family intramembrane serine protease [Nocardiopsis coralli]MBE3001793.1 rhomboid family intramembrane serine protease [Nocardiopsis coralli]
MSEPPPPTGASPTGDRPAPRTCYRHTDRETGVSCTRCGRPICPDCMVEAAVGFHCPDCVAEGNRNVRQARTVFGGKVIEKPYVTWTLLGLIAVGFVLQQLTPGIVSVLGMHGYSVYLGGEWYRLITSAFLHGGIFHLLFNGYALFLLGNALERWLGHGRFLALWLLGALSGSVLSLLAAPGQLSIGASGAIFALFGAAFVTGRRLGLDMRMILVLLVVNLGITFLVPNISWTAHIGGLVAGFAVGAVFALLPRGRVDHRRRTLVHTSMAAAYAVLLAALLIGGPVLVWPALGLV